MKVLRQRKYLFVLLALLVVFAACKGESPTAPQPSTGGGTGGGTTGGTTPPAGATISLAVSNPTPLVSSTTVITATVTQNGNPVPNGTAVEFNATDPGSFTDTNLATTIRTTTNGVATATLTSASAATIQVTANVNNVTAKTTVTFGVAPTTPPPTSSAPTISGISPTTGPPTGGQIVTITGTNFKAPVRVIFDLGGGVTKEAFVASVTPTQVQVISPAVDLGSGQTLAATVTLINQAGTASEAKVSASTQFTYALASLTPSITTVSPDSGPIEGGTRITIFGSGFQAPVQVGFSTGGAPWAQMQVISTTFAQIVALTPAARDVNPNGSGTLTGPVNLRVLNINSNKDVQVTAAFRYTPKMQITTVGPTEGPFTGGTRFTIDGIGFDDPLAVTTGGVAAQVVRVSGTEIIAITNAIQPTGCADIPGPIVVTNTNNGDSATGPTFTFRIPKPIILDVNGGAAAALGGTTTIKVKNAFGTPRFQIGGKTAQVTGSTFDATTNVTTFTVVVPPTLVLQTQACGGVSGVTFPVTTAFDVIYTSAETQCTDTFTGGQLVSPPGSPAIAFSPNGGFTPFTATFTPASAGPPAVAASVTPSSPQTVAIVNNGTAPLTINSITQTGPNCAQFTISTPTAPATLNRCDIGIFTVQYNGPTPPARGSGTCSIVIDTNAGVKTLPLFGTAQ